MSSSRCVMHTPPKYSTIRVTNCSEDKETIKNRLQEFVSNTKRGDDTRVPIVDWHCMLDNVLVVEGTGPHVETPLPVQVYIDRKCGASVCRGADVHAVGVLATSQPVCCVEQPASLWIDLDKKCLRGTNKEFCGKKLFVGNGVLKIDRKDAFSVPQRSLRGSEGFQVTHPVWNHPNLPNLIENVGMAQNLPSIIVGHVLDPRPGEYILDMCSAPGGKALDIANRIKGSGLLVCLDISAKRLEKVKHTAEILNLMAPNVICFNCDATKNIVSDETECDLISGPPFAVEVFQRILVDATCSGTGQRPMFSNKTHQNELKSYPIQQKKLLATAYRLLRVGGVIVYSTCSVLEEENECIVQHFLQSYPRMKLVPQYPCIISPTTFKFSGLNEDECNLLQRFDPREYCVRHKGRCPLQCDYDIQSSVHHQFNLNCDNDTIGFFIAKFEKM